MDTFSKEERSLIMSKVKSKGNRSTELKTIKIFKELNINGWRRNYSVKGKPDFVFLKQKVAVFIDGCFWHGHNCRNTTPKDNAEYWRKKIEKNKSRDKIITNTLTRKSWTVIRIWECEITKKTYIKKIMLLKDLLY